MAKNFMGASIKLKLCEHKEIIHVTEIDQSGNTVIYLKCKDCGYILPRKATPEDFQEPSEN